MDLFDKLDAEFHFDDDPCPLKGEEKSDGLKRSWGKRVYVNPPYGKTGGMTYGVPKWLRKAHNELHSKYTKTKVVVFLLPVRGSVPWWHEWVPKASEIWFIEKRVVFKGASNSAPFSSVVLVYRKKNGKNRKMYSLKRMGSVVKRKKW